MPCSDGGYPYETPQPRKYNGLTAEQLEAALCAVFSTIETVDFEGLKVADVLNNADWKEAGVTRAAVAAWWKQHKAADRARKASEERQRAEAERQSMLKASGLNKLTPAERIALGLN